MGEHLPRAGRRPHGIDRDHDALAAEFPRRLIDQVRLCHSRRIHAALVRPGEQQSAHILHAAHAAADGQWQEDTGRGAGHHIKNGIAVFVTGGDVQEAQFVGAGRVVNRRLFHGIAGVAEGDEIHALDDATVLHVQTGDDTEFQHLCES